MEDRELLELAAKAAEVEFSWGCQWHDKGAPLAFGELWNPLTDDGDALRLAAHLCMNVKHDDPNAVTAGWTELQRTPITHDMRGPWYWKEWLRDNGNDRATTTRHAIVTAAATVGQKTP